MVEQKPELFVCILCIFCLQTHRQEIDNLKMRVDNLTTTGYQLMHSSSHVRASDIESHLGKLSEAWSRLDCKAKTRYSHVLCVENHLFDIFCGSLLVAVIEQQKNTHLLQHRHFSICCLIFTQYNLFFSFTSHVHLVILISAQCDAILLSLLAVFHCHDTYRYRTQITAVHFFTHKEESVAGVKLSVFELDCSSC